MKSPTLTRYDRLFMAFLFLWLLALTGNVWNQSDGLYKANKSTKVLATAFKILHSKYKNINSGLKDMKLEWEGFKIQWADG